MKLTEICIHRPVLATVLSLVLVILGVVTFTKLQVRHYPNIDQPVISIKTQFPGASADIVETQITKPIEDALAGLEGIQEMTSHSDQEQSAISLKFKLDRDIDSAANDVRDRVSKAKAKLPQNLQASIINKANADAVPTITLVLYPNSGGLRDVADYAKKTLEAEISSSPGVASVETYGGGELTMFVRVDPMKMAGHNITAEDVNLALKVQGFEKPAGAITNQFSEISVSTKAPLKTEEDFRNVVVAERKGYAVKISDIALEVRFEAVEKQSSIRFNGIPCVLMNVIKQSVANPIVVANSIHDLLPKIRDSLPPGMNIEVANDASIFIKRSINEVYQTIGEAAILVILVIFFFLRSFRASFIPIVTIPLSLIGTFAIMYAMGFSVNVLTLLAMVMAIGLVVDDAIVVLENIYRHIEEGMSPMQATIKGSKEIGVAVVAMTITLAAVYAPIALSSGMTGKIFSEFALTLAGAVILSGFIALTLSPMMCGRMLKMHEGKTQITHKSLLTFGGIAIAFIIGALYLENKFQLTHIAILTTLALIIIGLIIVFDAKISRFLDNVDKTYEKFLRASLMKTLFKVGKGTPVLSRSITILLGLIVASVGGMIALEMKQDLSTPEDQGKVTATGFIPQGASLEFVDKYMKQAEALFKKVPEMKGQLSFTEMKGGKATIENFLVPWEDRKRSSLEIAKTMRPILAENTGMAFTISGQGRSLTAGGRGNPIEIIIQTTKSFQELRSLFDGFNKKFAQIDGVDASNIEQTTVPDTQELVVDIDRQKAAELNVDLTKVGDLIEIMLSRNPATHFTNEGYRYPVVIELAEKFRKTPEDLASLYYRTTKDRNNKERNKENMVALGQFVDFKYKVMPGSIAHHNGMRSVTMYANLKPGAGLGGVLDEAKILADKVLPKGTARFDLGGESRSFREESSNIALIFILAVISIYLVLSAQYESFLDPLIIMVSVPLSLVGGILTLMLFGGDGFQTQSTFPWVYDFQFGTMTIFGKIGLVTLIGLITKHGILIVDFSNKLVAQGHDRFEAVIQASKQRLRPILMTTFAMVLGAIPLALASGAGYESRRQIGWVIVGGMTFGTIFTLFIVPAFYTYISAENLNKFLNKFKRHNPAISA